MTTNNNHITRLPGDGFNARIADETPPPTEPAAQPVAPSASAYTGQQRALPDSTKPTLHDFAKAVAQSLTRDLAAADALRLRDVRDLLPGMADANPKETLAQLARGVASKEISNQEATQLFETLHPGMKPEDVR
jgi:hypothetical protein